MSKRRNKVLSKRHFNEGKRKIISCMVMLGLIFFISACSGVPVETSRQGDENEGQSKDNSFSAERQQSEDSEATGSYLVQELRLKRDDLNIYGEIYLPGDGKDVYPVVIIGHEYGASHNSVSQYAEMFAAQGIASYIFDFCGGGTSSQSDGNILQMSVMTEVEDMEAVLEQIYQQDFTDKDNIFLMGCSQGGLVAAVTAAETEIELQGLVLFYPAFMIPDTARTQYSSIEEIPDTFNNLGITVGRRYYADIYDLYEYDVIAGFDKDVLIVHGDSDSLVPISVSEKAVEVYPSATLIPLEEANHVFYGEDAEKAGGYAIQFFKEHISL